MTQFDMHAYVNAFLEFETYETREGEQPPTLRYTFQLVQIIMFLSVMDCIVTLLYPISLHPIKDIIHDL